MDRRAHALLAGFTSFLFAGAAQAVPFVYAFTIAPESTLSISANGMAPAPLALEGVVTGSFELVGGELTVTSSPLTVGDFVVPYREDLEHGVISYHFSGATGHFAGGPTPALELVLPLEFDVAGFVLSIDAATIVTDDTGATFALPAPLELVLAPGILAADPINSSDPIAIPVSASAPLFGGLFEVSGTLLLEPVPEPGTLSLALLGLAALSAARRGRRRGRGV